MQTSKIAARLFLSRKAFAAVLLVFAASSPVAAVAQVALYFDSDGGPVEFAAHEITLALKEKDNSVDLHDLDQLESVHGTQIILTDLSNASTLQMFESNGVAKLEALQPEGFRIRVTAKGNNTTYWIIGADPAGTMYGGLEFAEVVRVAGLEAVKDDGSKSLHGHARHKVQYPARCAYSELYGCLRCRPEEYRRNVEL